MHVDAVQYKWFNSLSEMMDEASVVVTGRIVSVTEGRTLTPEPQYGERGSAHYLNATLQIDEIVHGSLTNPVDQSITVELFAPNVEAIPQLIGRPPSARGLFFLLNKAVHPGTAGLPPEERSAEAKYYEIMGDQAAFFESDGRATLPVAIAPGEFPSDLDGRRFVELVDLVRSSGH